MTGEPDSVSVSLSTTLAARLDTLVEEGVFGSQEEALRYGARLVIREETRREDGPIEPDNRPVDDSPAGRGSGGRSAHE